MMIVRFEDYGFIIHIIPFEESKRIMTVLTKDHGLLHGISDKSFSALTYVYGRWSSRTEGLGYWQLEEMDTAHKHAFSLSYTQQLTIQLLCDLLYHVLPLRHPYPAIFQAVHRYIGAPLCLTEFIDLLFLILDEIGYGPEYQPSHQPIIALKSAFDLFLKHCHWHSPYAHLLLKQESLEAVQ